MKNRHRVVWTKGMFLTPQHFQTQDQFFEDALQFRFAASQFANWGVTELDIDSEALGNGLFRLNQCAGIMPDGEPFDMPDTDELPPSRAVAEHFPPNRESLDVFLGIPENRPRARNVSIPGTAPAAGSPRRRPPPAIWRKRACSPTRTRATRRSPFRSRAEPSACSSKTSTATVSRRLRIAQVTRNAAGIPILNPRFVAPCLDLASSTYLTMLLRRQIEILATKSAHAFPARGGSAARSLAEFSPSETANFWLLHTVNSYLPELKHIWKVRKGHPGGRLRRHAAAGRRARHVFARSAPGESARLRPRRSGPLLHAAGRQISAT